MKRYNLGVIYSWEFDKDFVNLFRKNLRGSGLKTVFISYYNLNAFIELLKNNKIKIDFFLDRATDDDEVFYPLAAILKKTSEVLNNYEYMKFSSDKATMHLELITKGLNTPFTIIIHPFNSSEELQLKISDIAKLGRPFIIKPANTTGGGIGVVKGAETLNDILLARQMHKDDKYLLQKKIEPLEKDGHRFWFRCFWAFNQIICCWWNDKTHIYDILTDKQIDNYNLHKLNEYVKKIYEICKLNFFSTEIALDENNNFIVIDYVNDMCDLRLKSKHVDGVPDEIITQIIQALIKFIKDKNEHSKQNN